MLTIYSCDLALQENFEFVPEVDLSNPYDEISALDFIQSRIFLTDKGNLDGDELDYMAAAIKRVGMESKYSGSDTSRTYLLLNNSAFTGGGDIVDIVTGSPEVMEGESPDEVMARVDVDILRTVLEYHIVTSYVDQVPTLFEFGVNYIFQTLIPGEDGVISMRRNERYRIDINRAPAPLPSSATTQWERVRNHNYVFNNGIGHFISDAVRNKPY